MDEREQMTEKIVPETDEQMTVRMKHAEDAINDLPVLEGVKIISFMLGSVLRQVPKKHRTNLMLLCEGAAMGFANQGEEPTDDDIKDRIHQKILSLNETQRKIAFEVIDMMEGIKHE